MKTNWARNNYQFSRFIAEAEAAGAFTPEVLDDMAISMDLKPFQVCELIDRAQNEWEKIKEKVCNCA